MKGKRAGERIYYDRGSVLRQVGLYTIRKRFSVVWKHYSRIRSLLRAAMRANSAGSQADRARLLVRNFCVR
ncbi:MAG TPA: hypothetical protein VGN65_12635, partial [Casimicrobiaceae bacterium]